MRRPLATLVVATTLVAGSARGEPGPPGARSVGAAGSVTASVDDESAVLVNPGSLGRVVAPRVAGQLGVVATGGRSAGADDLAGTALVGGIGVALPFGERVVVAASLLWPVEVDHAFSRPTGPVDDDEDEDTAPARYAGTRLSLRQRAFVVAAAARILPWLAAGISGGLAHWELGHERVLWVGDLVPPDPALDARFAAADSAFAPVLALGLLAAPDGAPLELALALRHHGGPWFSATPSLSPSRDGSVEPMTTDPRATLTLPSRTTLVAGVRFLLPVGALELDAEVVWLGGPRSPAWTVTGMAADGAPVTRVPLGPTHAHTGGALRGSFELDVVPGFLSAQVGGAWERESVDPTTRGPLSPYTSTWTLAGGVSAVTGDLRLTLGLARRFSRGPAGSEVLVVTPAIDSAIPAFTGRVHGATTTVLLGVARTL